jgi:hypothetical protein
MYNPRIMKTTPQVLYNTPDPLANPSELYKVNAAVLDTAADPIRRWVVMEEHGYWDQATKQFLCRQPTLSPNDPKHCLSLEDAFNAVDAHVMARAKSGFKYLFEWYPYEPSFFRRFEIQKDGTRKRY